jgi:hypothetical protein
MAGSGAGGKLGVGSENDYYSGVKVAFEKKVRIVLFSKVMCRFVL